MSTLRQAAQQALDILEDLEAGQQYVIDAITAPLRQALEAERNEPAEFYDWWTLRPSLTRLQAFLLWREEVDADLGQIIAAEQQDEPVAWQCRARPDWDSKVGWSAWESCAKERAQDYWKHPALHNWQYEARALYTRPQPKRQPLTDEMVELGWELHGSSDAYQAWSLAVEWTERAHGIGGAA